MTATPTRPLFRPTVQPLEDRAVPATLSIGDVTVTEGTSGSQSVALTVTLSEPSKRPVSVNYGTVNNSATAGSDYVAASGKLNFTKGETQKTIHFTVYGDSVVETNESFYVRLTNPKGATIADSTGVVTILDPTPQISTSFEAADEGGVMTFTVTLSTPFSDPFTVDFTTGDYDAIAGQDYVETTGTLTFAPGVTTQTFTVEILADTEEEYDEQFYIDLFNFSTPVYESYLGWGYIYGEYGGYWW
jgi:hypothetical protein